MSDATSGFTVEQPVWDDLPAGDRRRRTRARYPALTILYHPDVQRVGERVILSGLVPGGSLPLSRLEPRFEAPYQAGARPLLDRCISRSPFLITMDENGALGLCTEGIRTRLVVDGVPVADSCAVPAKDVELGAVIEVADRIVLLLHTLPVLPLSSVGSLGLIGESEGIQRVRHEIRRVADLEVPVLLRGETGTGKELVANAIHQASPRRDGPCLSVNMGAIPATLATSELFGATKGSYTSSVRDQPGYFQRAHGGTLFLDEIGEASPEVQVMLLRVIETGEIQRVGGAGTQKVDVRLIAATDADLESEIEAGRFRAPLLHRLSGYELFIPPLRERRDDFGRLFSHFLAEELRSIHEEHRLTPPREGAPHWMPASIVARLARYAWPGNVRQLRNTVRQIVIGSRSSESVEIGPQVERLLRDASPPADPAFVPPAVPAAARRRAEAREYRSPAEVTEAELVEALRAHHWEVKLAAEHLGISRPSLYLLIDKFPSLRKAGDLSREEILEARELCGGSLDAMVARLEVSKKGLVQRITQLGIE
jgi:two-component system nitrogen regulation response regulator GlnG